MPKNLIPNHFDKSGIYVEGQRSAFPFKKPVITSFMSGMLVPMGDPIPVFPGTKLDLSVNAVIRSNTMVVPPLIGMYIDIFAVWVPHRIVWNEFPQFLGENDKTAWTQSDSYVYPALEYVEMSTLQLAFEDWAQDSSVSAGNLSLLEQYGIHLVDTSNYAMYNRELNVMAARGYYFIWNYLFRDENYQRPVLFSKSSIASAGEMGYFIHNYKLDSSVSIESDEVQNDIANSLLFCLMPVNKFHDVFTSVTPEAQYGDASILPLGTEAEVIYKGFSKDSEPFFVQSDNETVAFAGALSTYSTWVRSTNNTAQTSAVGYNPNGSLVSACSVSPSCSASSLASSSAICFLCFFLFLLAIIPPIMIGNTMITKSTAPPIIR